MHEKRTRVLKKVLKKKRGGIMGCRKGGRKGK